MHSPLPTGSFGEWAVTDFLDSLVNALRDDVDANELRMFFYAVTTSGWNELRSVVRDWAQRGSDRTVTAHIGTDHALTDPAAVRQMLDDGVSAQIMCRYQGIFHPKLVWLAAPTCHVLWAGSNNLTRDGLLNNVEFSLMMSATDLPASFHDWVSHVDEGSAPATEELLRSYEAERRDFERARASANSLTFTWEQRGEPDQSPSLALRGGDLVVEVMPRETGSDGRQLQLPVAAAQRFFGISEGTTTCNIELQPLNSGEVRSLTMTLFPNNTIRLSIADLEYRDRPCVIVFRQGANNVVSYEIIPKSIFPIRYRDAISRCSEQTREGSRRWGIL